MYTVSYMAVNSLFLTQKKISKVVMYDTICVNYEAKIEAGTGAVPK